MDAPESSAPEVTTVEAAAHARRRRKVLLRGAAIGSLLTAALYISLGALGGIQHRNWDIPVWVVANLFLVPFTGGLLAARIWRPLRLSLGASALHSLWMTLLGCAGAAVILREGAVCLVIAF